MLANTATETHGVYLYSVLLTIAIRLIFVRWDASSLTQHGSLLLHEYNMYFLGLLLTNPLLRCVLCSSARPVHETVSCFVLQSYACLVVELALRSVAESV